MAEDGGQLRAVVRRVMNLRVRYRATNFLTSSVTITQKNSVALVRTRTIPTERPPPVGEVGANFCG